MSRLKVRSAASAGTASTGTDRRQLARIPCDLDSACQPVSGSTAEWPAIVRDLSRTGVGLIVSRRFEPGAVLNLTIPGLRETVDLYVRVARVSRTTPTEWLLGCTVVGQLGDDQINSLLQ